MEHSLIIANEIVIISLLMVAIIASMVLRHMKMPYTIGLVIIGFAFAYFVVPQVSTLAPLGPYFPTVDVILYLFLPPLIFESALAVNTRLLQRNIAPILSLAIFGVIISAGIIGYMLSWFFAIPLLFALLFGALISSTDPVAVISIFREIGVPKRLQILVEGESLLNDACSIIMFQMVLLLITQPLFKNELTFLETSGLFINNLLFSFFGGILVGIIGGLVLRTVIRKTPLHPHLHQTATLVAAYLTYLIGDELGFSGVIAVVVCGIYAARAASDWIGPKQREHLDRFWEYIGFLANSLIFLLVGITLASLHDLSLLIRGGILGLLFLILAVLIGRLIPVLGTFSLCNRFSAHPVPFPYQMVCFWGGLRGAVSIALVLSIPHSLPYRDLIVACTVMIVLFTIFIQGMTIGPLIRFLGLGETDLLRRFHQIYADLICSRAARKGLEQSMLSGIIEPEIIDTRMSDSSREIEEKEQKIQDFWNTVRHNPDRVSVIRLFWLEALRYEQKQYRQLYDEGLILPSVYAELEFQTSIREDLIQAGNYHPAVELYAPRSRFSKRIKRIFSKINPDSMISRVLDQRIEVNLIFGAIAVAVATEATIRFVHDLSDWVCLDRKEVADVISFYRQMEENARKYLHSDAIAGSRNLQDVSRYMADRTAEAGKVTMLYHHVKQGIGDEKMMVSLIDCLIKEKNKARKEVIRSCGDEIV